MQETILKPKPQLQAAPSITHVCPVQTLCISLNIWLKHTDLESFRGAVAELAMAHLPKEQASLFHNHNNDEVPGGNAYLYRYPRIQYRVHQDMATLFAINEGAEALDALCRIGALAHFNVKGRPYPLTIINRDADRSFPLQFTPAPIPYRIYRYLPLNSENYEVYKALDNLADRINMLERLLANHMVGFGRQVGWEWEGDQQLQVRLRDIAQTRTVNVLGVPNIGFDLDFTASALLPDRMALGRKTAFGFGWLHRLPK